MHFQIINPVIPIWVSTGDFFGAKKKRSSISEGIIESDIILQNEFLFYSLVPVENTTEYSINLATRKYFIKPYITSEFRNYFEQKNNCRAINKLPPGKFIYQGV